MIIKYKSSQLPEILRDMASYVENLEEDCERDYYFTMIVQTGLFHDAIGKMIGFDDDFTSVSVTTDY